MASLVGLGVSGLLFAAPVATEPWASATRGAGEATAPDWPRENLSPVCRAPGKEATGHTPGRSS